MQTLKELVVLEPDCTCHGQLWLAWGLQSQHSADPGGTLGEQRVASYHEQTWRRTSYITSYTIAC